MRIMQLSVLTQLMDEICNELQVVTQCVTVILCFVYDASSPDDLGAAY
jgi:hypothetical protein